MNDPNDPFAGLESRGFQTPGGQGIQTIRRRKAGTSGGGAALILSNSTVLDSAGVDTLIGTLAVLGGTGSYTYTFLSNPGGLFSILGAQLKVAAALVAGSDPITIQADNGITPISSPFVIVVTTASSNIDDDYAAWMAAA